MENLKEEIRVHPADVLSKALDRVNGLLGVLGQLFDADRENFTGGNVFIAHGIATSSTLVADARLALEDLHYSCDLTLLDHPENVGTVMEMSFAENQQAAADIKPVTDDVQQSVAETVQVFEPIAAVAEPQEEQIAQTYLELLRKLTAAEVFAVEQQALAVPGASTQLLPLLRSLREDLQKIHSAA